MKFFFSPKTVYPRCNKSQIMKKHVFKEKNSVISNIGLGGGGVEIGSSFTNFFDPKFLLNQIFLGSKIILEPKELNFWSCCLKSWLDPKGGVYLGAGYGILAPIFIFFVQMTWKIDIVEALDASLRCQSFKTPLPTFNLFVFIIAT